MKIEITELLTNLITFKLNKDVFLKQFHLIISTKKKSK